MCSLYGEFFHCCCNDKGSVNLKFTYRKVRFLTVVYFVPEIRKNLVLEVFIINLDLSLSLSQINLWAKGCAFVGKSHLFEGMFKLNHTNKVNNSTYLDDSISLLHNILATPC
jgi:hypothetical protein